MNWHDLKLKVFLDSANLGEIEALAGHPLVKGFTTNPTLMRRAGVTDYAAFGHALLQIAGERPVSFEVFSDEHYQIVDQACKLASWGPNVYVKLPVLTLSGRPFVYTARCLIEEEHIPLNVTGLTTFRQVYEVSEWFAPNYPGIISLFCGRMADTGLDVACAIQHSQFAPKPKHAAWELLWASTREVLNVVQAEQAGFDIITVTPAIFQKLDWLGRNLDAISLETVQQFYKDAAEAGYTL